MCSKVVGRGSGEISPTKGRVCQLLASTAQIQQSEISLDSNETPQ